MYIRKHWFLTPKIFLNVIFVFVFLGYGNVVHAKNIENISIDIDIKNIQNYLLIAFLADHYKINLVIGDEFKRIRINVDEKSISPRKLIEKIVNQSGLSIRSENGIMMVASECRLNNTNNFSGPLANKERASLNFDRVDVKTLVDIFANFVETSIHLNDVSPSVEVSYVSRNKSAGELFKALSIVQGWVVDSKLFGGYNLYPNRKLNNCIASIEGNKKDSIMDEREFKCNGKFKDKCDVFEKYTLNELLFIGYIRDSESERFNAVIETIDEHIHRLQVGHYMGKNFGEVIKIDEKGHIFIREIVSDNADGWLDRDVVIELGVRYETPREKLLKKLSPPVNSTRQQADFINAARNGYLSKLKLMLVKYQIDINAVSKKEGLNALTAAIYQGRFNIVEWLIGKGARVDVLVSKREKSPLLIAASVSRLEIVKLLLSAGANTELDDYKELTPLYMATVNNEMQIVNLLINNRANIYKYNSHGLTAFSRAAHNGYIDIINIFLKNGLSINAKDRNGYTMLISAVYGNKEDLVRLLISKGAKVNLSNKQKETALNVAVKNNNKKLVTYLKSKGAILFNKK